MGPRGRRSAEKKKTSASSLIWRAEHTRCQIGDAKISRGVKRDKKRGREERGIGYSTEPGGKYVKRNAQVGGALCFVPGKEERAYRRRKVSCADNQRQFQNDQSVSRCDLTWFNIKIHVRSILIKPRRIFKQTDKSDERL